MAPFKILNTQESKWAKEWLLKQVTDGRLYPVRPETILRIEGVEGVTRFIDQHLDGIDQRKRLQKHYRLEEQKSSARGTSTFT